MINYYFPPSFTFNKQHPWGQNKTRRPPLPLFAAAAGLAGWSLHLCTASINYKLTWKPELNHRCDTNAKFNLCYYAFYCSLLCSLANDKPSSSSTVDEINRYAAVLLHIRYFRQARQFCPCPYSITTRCRRCTG